MINCAGLINHPTVAQWCTVASQQEGLSFDSGCLHLLPMFTLTSSHPSKMYLGLIGDSKLGVNVSVCGCLFICLSMSAL